ncbi:lipopolysaccharide biosynthesis protein [Blastococcus sp. SYSU DS0973]
MTDLSRRATFVGGLWSVASVVFPLISTLLLSIVIARRLGSAELGEQSVIAYVGSSVAGMVVFAATRCAMQVMAAAHGRGDSGQAAAMDRLSRRVHVVAGVVAGLGMASFGILRDHALAWALIGLVTFIDAIGWSYGARLIAQRGWRAVSPLRLMSQIVAALLGVVAVLLGGGIAWVFAAQVLTSTWLTVILRRRDERTRRSDDVAPSRLTLRPLGRLWLLFILLAALTQVVDKRMELLFLDFFRSPHEVAVYAVAFSLVTVAVTVPGALTSAAIPGIAAAGAADGSGSLGVHLRRAARLASVAATFLTAGLAALGPSVVVLFWGAELQDAAAILPWMAISVLFVPTRVLLEAYWTGVDRLPPVLWATGAGALADIVVAAALVPPFGIAGAVAANVAAQVVACGLLVGYTRRHAPGVRTSGRHLVRAGAPAIVAGAAGWLAAGACAGPGPLIALVAGAGAFLAVVVVVGLVGGLVPAEDADWLVGTLPTAAQPALVTVGGLRWAQARRAPELVG